MDDKIKQLLQDLGSAINESISGDRHAWPLDALVGKLLRLDIAKARQALGWAPVWPLGPAVASTARWYRGWLERGALRPLTDDERAGVLHRTAAGLLDLPTA